MTGKFKRIDGLPTSKYGTTLAKKCGWCYNIINFNPRQTSRKNNKDFLETLSKGKFCCEDCSVEYKDWRYICKRKIDIERIKFRYKTDEKFREQRKAMYKEKYNKDKEQIIAYQKKYNKENREKINKRSREKYLKNKVALLKQLNHI